MFKRLLCALLCALMLLNAGIACAATPKEIYPLDYDSLPEPREGQHHYLLACIDKWYTQDQQLSNTDGLILVTLDTQAKRLMLTTFSREMLIKRPDGGIGRITYIAKNYGMDELCKVISTHFGVKVDKYIVFSMDNVQSIIDRMGGVTITVDEAEATYLKAHLTNKKNTEPQMKGAGTYHFNGSGAVTYMRARKVGGEGESGRTRRMRTVMSTLAHKYETATLGDALALLTMVSDNLVVMNLTMEDLVTAVGYAMELRGIEPEGLQMPSNAALTDIFYAGMQTREVDFDMARAEMAAFLEGTIEQQQDLFEVTE